MSMRSAGPLISKFRNRTLARKSDRISSTQSYDSFSGVTSKSAVLGGSGGRVYAGPRVRVRRGRMGKLPNDSGQRLIRNMRGKHKALAPRVKLQ